MNIVDELRSTGATVHVAKGSTPSVRLETNMLFVDVQVVRESLLELRAKALMRDLSATDKLMLLVLQDSNIKV